MTLAAVVTSRIEGDSRLDSAAGRVSEIVRGWLDRSPAAGRLLHGAPLGHPLHPVLVQGVIGALVGAAIADYVPAGQNVAHALSVTALATAGPAIAAGLADASQGSARVRRVALVHAAVNSVGLAFSLAGEIARARGQQVRSRGLTALGLVGLGAGGYLGGHLSYALASGVSRAADVAETAPQDWTRAGRAEDVPASGLIRMEAGGVALVLTRNARGEVCALAETCSHLGGPLSEGSLTMASAGQMRVTCPWHGSTFEMADGSVVRGPASAHQPAFDVRVEGEDLLVRLRQAPAAGR